MKVQLFKEWRWRSVNRPMFHADRLDDRKFIIWVDWGNGTGDPVWTLGVEITLGKGDTTE
jgi:hypothetical protein